MVAYSFKQRFTPGVEALTKRQTIRGHRKRHARPGEGVQLFYAMRTKHCRKLVDPDPICLSVEPIRLVIRPKESVIQNRLRSRVQIGDGPEVELGDSFAQADGFLHADDMVQFWRVAHGAGVFTGVLIKW